MVKPAPSFNESLAVLLSDPFELREIDSVGELKIANTEGFSPATFDTLLLKLGEILRDSNSAVKTLVVEATGGDQTIFKAQIYKADVEAFVGGTISQAELIRRFQVTKVETIESLRTRTRESRLAGRTTETKEALIEWLKLEPDSVQALSVLGNILREEKEYWEAINEYQKILKIDPSSLFAHHNLGYTYHEVGAFDDSIKAYRKALELDPQSGLLMRQLAQVYLKSNDLNGALSWVEKARTLGEPWELLMVEGNIRRESKKFDLALKAYTRAQQLNPEHQGIFFNIILNNIDQRRLTQAKKDFVLLKEKDPLLAGELSVLPFFREE